MSAFAAVMFLKRPKYREKLSVRAIRVPEIFNITYIVINSLSFPWQVQWLTVGSNDLIKRT